MVVCPGGAKSMVPRPELHPKSRTAPPLRGSGGTFARQVLGLPGATRAMAAPASYSADADGFVVCGGRLHQATAYPARLQASSCRLCVRTCERQQALCAAAVALEATGMRSVPVHWVATLPRGFAIGGAAVMGLMSTLLTKSDGCTDWPRANCQRCCVVASCGRVLESAACSIACPEATAGAAARTVQTPALHAPLLITRCVRVPHQSAARVMINRPLARSANGIAGASCVLR